MDEPQRRGGGGGELLSKKIACNTYADVNRGTPRYSTRLEDYAEIFGDVAGACSIPFLDLPPALSCRVADPGSGGFDYSEVFGGVDFGKFATPFEELVAVAPTREDPSSSDGRRTKGEAANDRQATGELFSPRHSNGGLMASRHCDPLPSEFNRSGYAATEFNLSNKKTTNRKKEGQRNGTVQTETGEQQKKIPVSVSSKHLRSSENHSGTDNCNSCSSGGSISSGDASSSRKAYLTVCDISLRTQPLRMPPPSRPPPRLVEKEGYPKARIFSNLKASLDGEGLRVDEEVEKGNSRSFLDVKVDVSSSTAVIQEAMELAQAKLKGTKELMERSDLKSSWLSKSADKSEKWKINKEYHELVNTENFEMAEEVSEEEEVSMKRAKLATMISEVEQNKSMQDTLSYEIESNWKLKKDIVAPVACAREENANLETHDIDLEEVATQGVVQKFEVQYASEKVHLFSGSERNVNDNSVLDYVLCNKQGKSKLDSLDACGGENSSDFVEINVEEEIKEEKWKSATAVHEAEIQVSCRSCISKVEMEKTAGKREQLSATELNRNSVSVESDLRAKVDREVYTDEEDSKDNRSAVGATTCKEQDCKGNTTKQAQNELVQSCNLEKFEGHKMDGRHLWNIGIEDTIEIQVEPYFMDKYMSANVVPEVSAVPLNDTADALNTDLLGHPTTLSDLSMLSMKSEDKEIEQMEKELEEVAEEEKEKEILQEEKENIVLLQSKLVEDMRSVGLFEERSEMEEKKEREVNLKEEKEQARLMQESNDSEQANGNQKNLQEEILLVEAKERERKLKEEKERARLVEEQKERERERKKDRIAIERAFAEATERAERIAVDKVTTGSSKVKKASYESSEKTLTENASRDSKLTTECATDEWATADAREDSERDNTMSRDKFRMDIAEEHLQDGDKDGHDAQFGNTGSSKTCLVNSDYQAGEGESVLRCKARQERHQRIAARAAKALAEKNMRDVLAQREQSERDKMAESLDADLRRWSNGKEGNLRALLSTLQYILAPESGWQPIPLTEVITASAVKKAFRKATLCVHPDKLQQRGANIQQRYISEKVFDLLKEAWNRFNSEER
ncbi:auxilin-like protein 1 isoform X1 [Zingiber officinale]|uniref:auxilin-like protein 1 isoform X1 n=1 Tax=Zingiber officinale TaxID=94328 RepID=UPI001C4ABDFC|nr:auxilin-like protein 1 isoform X1 [Zingiber officinale]XP_042391286.1 auxilin-like protein 1 isoform X1 [Zingiber officinale]